MQVQNVLLVKTFRSNFHIKLAYFLTKPLLTIVTTSVITGSAISGGHVPSGDSAALGGNHGQRLAHFVRPIRLCHTMSPSVQ